MCFSGFIPPCFQYTFSFVTLPKLTRLLESGNASCSTNAKTFLWRALFSCWALWTRFTSFVNFVSKAVSSETHFLLLFYTEVSNKQDIKCGQLTRPYTGTLPACYLSSLGYRSQHILSPATPTETNTPEISEANSSPQTSFKSQDGKVLPGFLVKNKKAATY